MIKSSKYHALRNENGLLIREAKRMEYTDLEKAVELYRKALERMKEYTNIEMQNWEIFTGIAQELYTEYLLETIDGDIEIIDRITLCLKKLKRLDDIVMEVEKYLALYPSAKERNKMKKVLKRAKLI